MAGGEETLKSHAELDKDAIEKYNRIMQQSLERESRMIQHYQNRGNKLPSFRLEPLPNERQRLAGQGMNTEERSLRKQWVMDQKLSPNEPVFIPELYPQNPIRRMLAAPWDFTFKALKPILGAKWAGTGRWMAPRACMAFFLVWAGWYNLKYAPAEWTGSQGWHITESRDIILPGDKSWPNVPNREHDDYFDKGFKNRKALKDLKTSYVTD